MTKRHWFQPADPNMLGLLRAQAAVTVAGIEAFAAWAAGDIGAADRVRKHEHRADTAKREVQRALRTAFVTPLKDDPAAAAEGRRSWPYGRACQRVIYAVVKES